MAQKLFVNNTSCIITGQLAVRAGSTPGQELGVVQFTLQPNSQQYVPYGDASDPYMDSLEMSGEINGAVIVSDQIILQRGASMDNQFNMNDTIYVTMSNNSFVVSTANTWTT